MIQSAAAAMRAPQPAPTAAPTTVPFGVLSPEALLDGLTEVMLVLVLAGGAVPERADAGDEVANALLVVLDGDDTSPLESGVAVVVVDAASILDDCCCCEASLVRLVNTPPPPSVVPAPVPFHCDISLTVPS